MSYETETELLLGFLDEQRHHVLGILEGLSEEQLRRPVLPSGWHSLGMVKHLALADEHYWFRSVVGGESFGFFPQGKNAEWQLDPGESAEDIFGLYREEIERANDVIAASSARIRWTSAWLSKPAIRWQKPRWRPSAPSPGRPRTAGPGRAGRPR